MSNLALMEPKDIPPALDAVGKKQADLGRFIPLDPQRLSKSVHGKRRFTVQEMRRVEEFFEAAKSPGGIERLSAHRSAGATRIPVYGLAAPAPEEHGFSEPSIAFDASRIVDWITTPASHAVAGDLVAMRMPGIEMEPRIFQGELVVAQLNMPAERDRDCMVELMNGSALLRTFKGIRDGRVHFEIWNPHKQQHISATKVRAIHAVLFRL